MGIMDTVRDVFASSGQDEETEEDAESEFEPGVKAGVDPAELNDIEEVSHDSHASYDATVTSHNTVVIAADVRRMDFYEPGKDFDFMVTYWAQDDESLLPYASTFTASARRDNYVTIPAEIRNRNDIEPGQQVEITIYPAGYTETPTDESSE